jgi:hypothetical protein
MNNTQLRILVQKISEPFIRTYPWLESDGASFLLAHHLSKAGLPVTHLTGQVSVINAYQVGHDWLKLGPYTIDFKLKLWFPDEPNIPFGVFLSKEFANVIYSAGRIITAYLSAEDLARLAIPRPIPAYSMLALVLKAQATGGILNDAAKVALRECVQADNERCPALRIGPESQIDYQSLS